MDVNGPPKNGGKDKGGVTKVPNYLLSTGCTIQDLINDIAVTNAGNKGAYKKALKALAESLEDFGMLTEKEERALAEKAKIFVPGGPI